jgi:peptide-methionine (S)-S-oxide reductase
VYRKFLIVATTAVGVAAGLGIGFAAGQRVTTNRTVPAERAPTQTVTFAGGCFWGLEAAFRQVKGVTGTVVGYMRTPPQTPAAEGVRSHRLETLEACRVTFDPAQITYEKLVDYFLRTHRPVALGGRAPYLGSPGRLVVFFQNVEQARTAKAVAERLRQADSPQRFPIIEVLPEVQFDRAEEDQQRYLEKHGVASCRIGS